MPIRVKIRQALSWVLVVALAPAAYGGPATQPGAPGARRAFPTFGLSLADPPGFRRMAEGNPARIAQWTRCATADAVDVTSLLVVEVEAAAGRTVKDYAGMLALLNHAPLPAATLVIDQAPAYPLTAHTPCAPFAGVKYVVAQHEDQFYVISAMEAPGDDCSPALAALCQSIRWCPIADATAHLAEMSPEPVRIFHRIALHLPAAMRAGSVADAQTQAHWNLLDLKTHCQEMTLDCRLAAFDQRATFADVRAGYGALLKKRYGLSGVVAWQAAPGSAGLEIWISDPLEIATVGADNKTHLTTMRWALVNVRAQVVVMVFNLGGRTLDQARPYLEAVERIVASIRLVEP